MKASHHLKNIKISGKRNLTKLEAFTRMSWTFVLYLAWVPTFLCVILFCQKPIFENFFYSIFLEFVMLWRKLKVDFIWM